MNIEERVEISGFGRTDARGKGAGRIHPRLLEKVSLAALVVIFCAFTWRGLLMYYTGDDLMNGYWAWTMDHKGLAWSNLFIWQPVYRPLGETVYLASYAAFGFNPTPLYVFCWLLLIANVFAVYALFREILPDASAALTALALILVHGSYTDLYSSAGTIFDRLCFLFTALGMTAYIRARHNPFQISLKQGILLWATCVLAMDSKESGALLCGLFAAYELLFVLPQTRSSAARGQAGDRLPFRKWARAIAPLYIALGATVAAFFFGRLRHTGVLLNAPNYHAHLRLSTWLAGVARYATLLTYGHLHFTAATLIAVLVAMLLAALLLRDRILLFGWIWFVASVTPVALIDARSGYVLYVPTIGLGLFFAEAVALAISRLARGLSRHRTLVAYAAFALVAFTSVAWHAANWKPFPDLQDSPYLITAQQFQREYPTMSKGSRLLFVSDYGNGQIWDLTFLLRLLYHDRTLNVRRLNATPEQRPVPGQRWEFDHIFATAAGRYEELDNRDVPQSIRLHILKRYSVGAATAFGNRDHAAYIVSGIKDFESPDEGRWTEPTATLKFQVYPADGELALRYWIVDEVAAPPAKTLTVRVNGHTVGVVPLTRGENKLSFPVKASELSRTGFTLVELSVDQPYVDPQGTRFGVVLMNAGFEFTKP